MLEKTLRGHYQIIKHLGSGGFGETYLAEDLNLPGNPKCVIKFLKPQSSTPFVLETAKRLFDKEAEVLYKLGHHSQIPQLLAHFEEGEEFYLAQEFIDGDDLKHELSQDSQHSEDRVIELLTEVLSILEFVHQQQVVHRDIKPANLIRRKQDGRIVLIDFGAVKEISQLASDASGQTSITIAIGTPGYMPNEQLSGKPRFSSDIYAVGMLGIQALTGLSPQQLEEDPQTAEIMWRDRLIPGTCSTDLVSILDKMVRYDFRQRYQSATEVLQALASLFQISPNSATTIRIPAQTRIHPKKAGKSPAPLLMWSTLTSGVVAASVALAFNQSLPNEPITPAKQVNPLVIHSFRSPQPQPPKVTSTAIKPTPPAPSPQVSLAPNPPYPKPISTIKSIVPKPRKTLSPASTYQPIKTAIPNKTAIDKLRLNQVGNYDRVLDKGVSLTRAGQYSEALVQFDQLVKANPQAHEGWAGRGVVLSKLYRYNEAIASFDKALEIKPDSRIAIQGGEKARQLLRR
jgi:eukaryotic-like serine/threonine-protein kinase